MVFMAALKKEWLENIRKFRLLIVIGVFLLIGILSPTSAKLMPRMFELFEKSMDSQGMTLSLNKQPAVADALLQYNKNFGMIPLFIIILAAGLVSEEKMRGTAETVLTKPLPRHTFVYSKFFCMLLVLLAGMVTGAISCLFYTNVLFDGLDTGKYLLMNLLLFFYILPFLSIALFFSVMFNSTSASSGAGIAAYFIVLLSGAVPGIAKFTPQGLYLCTSKMAQNLPAGEWGGPLSSSVIIVFFLVIASTTIFKKQDI